MDRILGTAIRLLREQLKLSQFRLAALSGLSQGAISLIEDGNRWPDSTTIAMIGKGLGISPKRFAIFCARLPKPAGTKEERLWQMPTEL